MEKDKESVKRPRRKFYQKNEFWVSVVIIPIIISLLFGGKWIFENINKNSNQVVIKDSQINHSPFCVGDDCQVQVYPSVEDKNQEQSDNEYDLGAVYLNKGDYSNAEIHFSKAISSGNNVANSWFRKAEIAYMKKDYMSALKSYEYASKNCSIYFRNDGDKIISLCWDVYLGIADSLFFLKDYSNAKMWIDKIPATYFEGYWNLIEIKADIYSNNNLCSEANVFYSQIFDLLNPREQKDKFSQIAFRYCICKNILGELKDNLCVIKDRFSEGSFVLPMDS